MPDDDLERYEERPGLLSGTRYWDPDRPVVETIRLARKREQEINDAHRLKLKESTGGS